MISILLKTILFYIFIIICYRIMGKRELGQLSISDLTISILIAELIAISIEESKNIIYTIIPIIVLVILEIVFSYLELKCSWFKKIIDGKPSIIIDKFKINMKEMIKNRYSLTDLLTNLRSNGVSNINEVKYAVLETNGNLSIFKKNSNYPLPLIIDGKIEYESLKNIDKNKIWLINKLKSYSVKQEDILYAFFKNNTIYIIKKG